VFADISEPDEGRSERGDLDGTAFYAEHLLYLEKYLAMCHKMMLVDAREGTR